MKIGISSGPVVGMIEQKKKLIFSWSNWNTEVLL